MKLTRIFLAIVMFLVVGFLSTNFVYAVEEQKPTCPCVEEGCTAKSHLFLDTVVRFDKNYLCDSGVRAYDRPVMQEYLKLTYITHGLEFYLKSWASQKLVKDGGNLGGSEWDPAIIGVIFPIWKLKVDAGYAYYWLHPEKSSRGLHAIFWTVSLPNKFVVPYLNVEDDIPANKNKLEGGWNYRAGLNKCLNLHKRLLLILDLGIGGNDGPYGGKADFFSYIRGTATLEWQVFESFKELTMAGTAGYQKRIGHRIEHGGLTPDTTIARIETRLRHDLLGR